MRDIEGLPVVDATEPLLIHVRAIDIKGASKKKPGDCAIARACRRELRKGNVRVVEARVHLSRTYLLLDGANGTRGWLRYMTPQAARDEIIAFDRGGSFAPGEITFKPPRPAEKLGASRKRHPDSPPRPQRGPVHIVKDVRGRPA